MNTKESSDSEVTVLADKTYTGRTWIQAHCVDWFERYGPQPRSLIRIRVLPQTLEEHCQ